MSFRGAERRGNPDLSGIGEGSKDGSPRPGRSGWHIELRLDRVVVSICLQRQKENDYIFRGIEIHNRGVESIMPTISMFFGIIIYMYYFDNKEHSKPHIHANFAEYDAIISIPDGDVLSGNFPNNKLKLIKAWIEIHQEELMADWKLAVDGQQPFKIDPLR